MDKSKLPVVTSEKFYSTLSCEEFDPHGLLSEQIFGPVKNYRCACGNFSTEVLHHGERCPKCGILCTTNKVRFTTFAKIVLPLPVYKQKTISKNLLLKVVTKKFKRVLDPIQSDLGLSTPCYLSYIAKKDKIKLVENFDESCIYLSITGLFTLFLGISFIANFYNSKHAQKIVKTCFDNEILVTPPGTRHYFVQSIGDQSVVRRHDINDFYYQILKLVKYDWSYIETDNIVEKYIEQIRRKSKKDIIYETDELKFYDQIVCRYQYYSNQIYRTIIDELSYKEGYIRHDFLGRSIDFSSRAHIICDPSLEAHQIKICKESFIRLWYIEYQRYLFLYENVSLDWILSMIKKTEDINNCRKTKQADDFIEHFFKNSGILDRLILINRQPTLFRYGIPAVEVVGITEGNVTAVSPLFLEATNADFDGDTAALYRCHSKQGQLELHENAFFKKCVFYDHNNEPIQTLRIETMYSAYIMLSAQIDDTKDVIEIKKLQTLNESFELINELDVPVLFNNKFYSYGVVLFNKWAGFHDIVINHFMSTENISRKLIGDSVNDSQFQTRISILSRKLFWFSTVYKESLSVPLDSLNEIKPSQNTNHLLKNLPKNAIVGQHIYSALINDIYKNIPPKHTFSRLINADLGKVKKQLARMVGSIGYIADNKNIIFDDPIMNTVLNGLDEDLFFNTSYGTRKGIVDKAKVTPDSGYMERSVVLNLSPVEITEKDCGSDIGFNIYIKNVDHGKSLLNRYFYYSNEWILFEKHHIDKFIDQNVLFRSPICCKTKNFKICQKCFGEYELPTNYVGILAGQYISERLTQLSMRTFHTSGSCSIDVDNKLVNFLENYLIDIKNYSNSFELIFKIDIPEDIILTFKNNSENTFLKCDKNIIKFNNAYGLINKDVAGIVKDMDNLLSREFKNITPVDQKYQTFIESVLKTGNIYSSFIEVILCNMYVARTTDTNEEKVLRYALHENSNYKIIKKLSVKSLHRKISRLLGLLYEPNEKSICRYADDNRLPQFTNSVFENLWRE